MENNKKIILEVKNLKKYFPLKKDILGNPIVELKAVDNVSFSLESGKTIGVVGESGCGKTTLGRTILQLYETTGGKSLYYGHSIEEFLPRYYINGIKKLSLNAKSYNILKIKLNELANSNDEYSFLLNNDDSITIADYLKYIEQIEKEILSLKQKENSVKIEDLNKVKKVLVKIVDVLQKSSITTGGYLLSNNCDKVKELLIAKLYNENELIKCNKQKEELLKLTLNDNSLAELQSKIDHIFADVQMFDSQLIELKNEIKQSKLFLELEENIEKGLDLAKLTKSEIRSLRTEIQLIFQDPYSSLPPRMTIGSILTEPVKVHGTVPKEKINEHVHQVMKMCGLQPQYYDRYPHEFSGGQRQRICIARALVVNPKLVICDEPVSALDVSIQAQIINLLKQLQNQLGLTYMFISHDLSVVKYITDNIIVMYLGNMMEIGDTKDIFQNPLHPYTQALFSAVPVPDPDAKMNRIILKGDIPSPANPPKGCKFHTRCEKCMAVCKLKTPKFVQYDENHLVACHLYDNEVMADLRQYENELAEKERIEEGLEKEKK